MLAASEISFCIFTDSLRASLPRVERYLNYDRPVAAHGLAKHDRV